MVENSEKSENLTYFAEAEPAEIIFLRVKAFRLGNFGLIYDSYHPDSYFCANFPDREEYIRYAWAHLRRDFRILDCEVLRERQLNAEEFQLIFRQVLQTAEGRIETLELARFNTTEEGWRYHSSQKLTTDDFPGDPRDIDFSDFERQTGKVYF